MNTQKRMKNLILILSVLLGMSLIALAGIILYGKLRLSSPSAIIPDNYIEPQSCRESSASHAAALLGTATSISNTPFTDRNSFRNCSAASLSKTVLALDSAKETTISLYKNHAEDSTPFYSANLFPGDAVTRAFLIEVSHKGTVTVQFHADIRSGYEKLAEVLKCKVVLRNERQTLYDGLMRDMPTSLRHPISSAFGQTTTLIYDITVYLDTSVGNDYRNKELIADFRWWAEESGDETTPPSHDSAETTDPDDGELIVPPTGDAFHLCIWFGIAMISLLINIVLLGSKRRRNNGEQEGETVK